MFERKNVACNKIDNASGIIKLNLVRLLLCSAFVACDDVRQVDATIITSVSYVFEGFSPYSMIRFFEFSDKGWSISETCLRDMYNYLEGLRKGALWAVKCTQIKKYFCIWFFFILIAYIFLNAITFQVYDASGYYGGGAFGASTSVRINNPNLCRALLQQHEVQILQASWSYLANTTVVPFAVHIVLGHYLLEIADEGSYKFEKIHQLICFPSSCTHADVHQVLEVYLFQSNHIVKNNTYLGHRFVNDNFSVISDLNLYMLLTFFCVSIFIYIMFYFIRNYLPLFKFNVNCTNPKKLENSFNLTNDNETPIRIKFKNLIGNQRVESAVDNIKTVNFINEAHIEKADNLPRIVSRQQFHQIEEVLNAVSLHNVLYSLFQDDTTPQAAIYVAFTITLIYAHLLAEVKFMSNNFNSLGEENPKNFMLKNASYVIDVYFFVSGLRLAYQFFRTFPRDKLNVFEQLMHVLRIILYKFVCLSPSYTFCVFAEHLLDTYFFNKITLEIPSYDYDNCKDNKLSNILYLDTFFPLTERCMPWTWFMSLEVQFFIVACLILLVAEIHPRYAIIIGATIFLIAMLAATVWELNPRSQSGYNNTSTVDNELAQFNLIFDNICLRIIPYLLGICLGYILHKTNSNIHLNIFVFICGWIACCLILCLFFFGYDMVAYHSNKQLQAFLITLSHTMWCIMLLWIILTGITQYGEFLKNFLYFKYFNTLERLSPICLLIAPIVIRLLVFTADAPIYSSNGQIFAMSIGCLLAIYMCALVLHVFFDGPVCAIMEVMVIKRMLST